MKKKIALIGNNGNWNFALLRYLIGKNYEASIFINHKIWYPFNPLNDTFSLKWNKYIIYMKEYNYPPSHKDVTEIKDLFKDFDFIISNGPEAHIAFFAGIIPNIYIPYGHDIHHHPWQIQEYGWFKKIYYYLNPRRNYYTVKYGTWDKLITETLKNSYNLLFDKTNGEIEKLFSLIKTKGKRWVTPPPFLYLGEFVNEKNEFQHSDIHWKSIIDEIRQQYDFILLYASAQHWIEPSGILHKGTDNLIKGYARFLQLKNQDSKCILLMQESGKDLIASKELIKNLGIEHNVLWIPTMARKDIMYYYFKADLCAGEFDQSFLTYGTIVDAMSIGKPIIAYRQDDLYTKEYDKLYPMLNAKTPDQIAEKLILSYKNKNSLEEIGLRAQEWVKTYLIERPLSIIESIINNQ